MKVWQVIAQFIINGIIWDLYYKYEFKRCISKGRKRMCRNWQCKMSTQCEFSRYYGYEPRKKKHS